MKNYTKKEWEKEQYKGRWDDSPFLQDRVKCGEVPAEYIGRRNVMVNDHDGKGSTLLTEGVHFLVYDDEGRKYIEGASGN